MFVFKRLRGRKNMMIGVYLSALVCGKKCVSLERKKERKKNRKNKRFREKREARWLEDMRSEEENVFR